MNALSIISIPEQLRERFRIALKYKKALFIHAPCGCGKTTVTRALLAAEKSLFVDGADCLELPEESGDYNILVIDNIHCMDDTKLLSELCSRLRTADSRKFVFLSRGVVPGCLLPFLMAGVMELLETEDLFFDKSFIRCLAEQKGLFLTGSDIDGIFADTSGYPVAVSILLSLIKKGKSYQREIYDQGRQRLFYYFDELVYQKLPKHSKFLLLKLSPFEEFDVELARMISGESFAGEIFARLRDTSSMFLPREPEVFQFQPIFRSFLLWKLSTEFSSEEEKAIYQRAGLYYELHENMKNALDCYARIGDHRKISELLQKNAKLHVGMGQYLDMEKYYFSMPEEEIEKSPVLMAAMSMICSLFVDYERSDMWYDRLKAMADSLKRSDEKYEEAKSRLAYLDIALPQKGTKGLWNVIKSAFSLSEKRELSLPRLSVTSTLPSVLNGGKDLCLWTKQDTLVYPAVKKPVEGILGRDGVGLVDLGMCECKFEKDENYQPWLLNLAGQLTRIQQDGTADIEFAAVGLLARVQVMQGNPQAAIEALNAFRNRINELGEERFLPSLEALLCRIYLRLGKCAEVKRWFLEKAPTNDLRIWVLHRYQYFTKVLVLVANGDCSSALIILKRLLPYTQKCGRIMDEIHVHLLSAICHYRMKNESWQQELSAALDMTREYHFVTPVAQYGRAILPLLVGTQWHQDQKYLKRLLSATRAQAAHYPAFLQHEQRLVEPLTCAEQQVLQLLCQNMSNQEICEILGIKLSTAKTHVSHILQKLEVKRRNEVKSVAEKNGLIHIDSLLAAKG